MLSVSHYTIKWGLFNEKLQRNKYFKKSLHNSKNTAEIPPMYFVYTYFVQLGKNFDDNCGFKMFLKYIQEKVLLNHLEKYIVNLKIQFLFRHFDPEHMSTFVLFYEYVIKSQTCAHKNCKIVNKNYYTTLLHHQVSVFSVLSTRLSPGYLLVITTYSEL